MEKLTPTISVLMVTYNHAPYIEKALKSVLEQETEYSFELIVCDDASTDNTALIVKSYQSKYKNLILLEQNKNSRGIHNHFDGYNYIKSKYIAYCEGDDFWTSKTKLQKQISFLEKNHDFNVCCHKVEIQYAHTCDSERSFVYKNLESDSSRIRDGVFYADELIDNYYMHTSSFVFRYRFIDGLPSWIRKWMIFDHGILMLHAHESKTKYFDEAMSVWRRNETGFSWLQNIDKTVFFQKEGHGWIRIYQEMDNFFNGKYHHQIKKRIILSLKNMVKNHLDNGNYYQAKKLLDKYQTWCEFIPADEIEFSEQVMKLKSLENSYSAPWSKKIKESNFQTSIASKCEVYDKLSANKNIKENISLSENKNSNIIDILYKRKIKSIWIPSIYELELVDVLDSLNILYQIYPTDINLNPSLDFISFVGNDDAILIKRWQNQEFPLDFIEKIKNSTASLIIEDNTESIYRDPARFSHISILKSQNNENYIFHFDPSKNETKNYLAGIFNEQGHLEKIQKITNENWDLMNSILHDYSFGKIEIQPENKSSFFSIYLPTSIPLAFFITAMRHCNVVCKIVPNNSKDTSHLSLLTSRISLLPCGSHISRDEILRISNEAISIIKGNSSFGNPGTRPN